MATTWPCWLNGVPLKQVCTVIWPPVSSVIFSEGFVSVTPRGCAVTARQLGFITQFYACPVE
jgi:hypothetical protein